MANAQEWLDKEYPKNGTCIGENDKENKEKRREEITELDLSNKELKGKLKLSGFNRLKEFVCFKNLLTSLEINDCLNLTMIDCSDNLFTDLELPAEISRQLVFLNISNNDFLPQNLTCFKKFTNLRKLYLGNSNQRIEQNNYNRFFGSLEDLQNLSKLEDLGISNTNIDSGLEYLPESLKTIRCASQKQRVGCAKIQEKLQDCLNKKNNYYEFQVWKRIFRDDHSRSSTETSRPPTYTSETGINRLHDLVNELSLKLDQTNQRVSQLEEEIKQLKKQNDKKNPCNILLIGKSGSGKSTLANVLSGTSNFKEKDGMVSETKNIRSQLFETHGKIYRVIDTVGLSDNTGLSEDDIFKILAQTVYSLKDGISQILFVTKDKFDKDEIKAFDLLKETVFDQDIVKYTTIVRTNSSSFENNEWRDQEWKNIIEKGGELLQIVSSCEKIIYVDNGNQENKEKSRILLLEHLATCQQIYKLQGLEELKTTISSFIEKEKAKEKTFIEQKDKKWKTVAETVQVAGSLSSVVSLLLAISCQIM